MTRNADAIDRDRRMAADDRSILCAGRGPDPGSDSGARQPKNVNDGLLSVGEKHRLQPSGVERRDGRRVKSDGRRGSHQRVFLKFSATADDLLGSLGRHLRAPHIELKKREGKIIGDRRIHLRRTRADGRPQTRRDFALPEGTHHEVNPHRRCALDPIQHDQGVKFSRGGHERVPVVGQDRGREAENGGGHAGAPPGQARSMPEIRAAETGRRSAKRFMDSAFKR